MAIPLLCKLCQQFTVKNCIVNLHPAKVQPTGTSMEGKLSPLTSLADCVHRYTKIVSDLFYVHHVICLPLQKDGSIIYDAREILSIRFFCFFVNVFIRLIFEILCCEVTDEDTNGRKYKRKSVRI